jgi:hypothetical protein
MIGNILERRVLATTQIFDEATSSYSQFTIAEYER